MKRILSLLRKTINKYDMIKTDDTIAIAVSGGKDSMVLLEAMYRYQKFSPIHFEIGVIYIDIGFEDNNCSVIENICKNYSIPFVCENTFIKHVVFDVDTVKNPCSLCSRMRRAALCDTAKRYGYNKIALGHNRDDANETLMLNLLRNAKIECFEPKTTYDDVGITIIRPLVATPEHEIYSCARRLNLPICQKNCPADGNTDRERIKQLIHSISNEIPDVKKNIFSAIQKLSEFSSKEKREE
ncbi:MAG: tRNA lysidine(34) synthetase TilS [Clostridia bacterium]|nr:tRNA lysidine(34) synthetase TilS [Clostridia bacterium]